MPRLVATGAGSRATHVLGCLLAASSQPSSSQELLLAADTALYPAAHLWRWLATAAGLSPLPPLEPWASPGAPISRAATPPSSWYTQPAILEREERAVFHHSWLAVAYSGQLATPGAFAAGSLLSLQWLACRDEQGQLRAFHNVCRHHAAILAVGSGTATCFTCPYHGWTYGMDGRLQRATRLKGIEDFRAPDHGLLLLQAEEWAGLIWVRQQQPSRQQQQAALEEQQGVAVWLGPSGSAAALAAGIGDHLVHVASRSYELACNWKVFADNYLDGGYHVSVAHPELASSLDLPTYRSFMYERLSIQSCQPAPAPDTADNEAHSAQGAAADSQMAGRGPQQQWQRQRLARGRPPAYVFVYPNLMLNRYGPWLDTNTVVPIAADRCKVLFHYFLDASLAGDARFVEDSLVASHRVQLEDVALCESVQRGLASTGYDTGRYAPGVEGPMHHFHLLLHADLVARG